MAEDGQWGGSFFDSDRPYQFNGNGDGTRSGYSEDDEIGSSNEESSQAFSTQSSRAPVDSPIDGAGGKYQHGLQLSSSHKRRVNLALGTVAGFVHQSSKNTVSGKPATYQQPKGPSAAALDGKGGPRNVVALLKAGGRTLNKKTGTRHTEHRNEVEEEKQPTFCPAIDQHSIRIFKAKFPNAPTVFVRLSAQARQRIPPPAAAIQKKMPPPDDSLVGGSGHSVRGLLSSHQRCHFPRPPRRRLAAVVDLRDQKIDRLSEQQTKKEPALGGADADDAASIRTGALRQKTKIQRVKAFRRAARLPNALAKLSFLERLKLYQQRKTEKQERLRSELTRMEEETRRRPSRLITTRKELHDDGRGLPEAARSCHAAHAVPECHTFRPRINPSTVKRNIKHLWRHSTMWKEKRRDAERRLQKNKKKADSMLSAVSQKPRPEPKFRRKLYDKEHQEARFRDLQEKRNQIEKTRAHYELSECTFEPSINQTVKANSRVFDERLPEMALQQYQRYDSHHGSGGSNDGPANSRG